jgi:hypothetical protein
VYEIEMKNPAASSQRAAGLLATLLRPKPYSGFFRKKLYIMDDINRIRENSLKIRKLITPNK